MSNVSAGTDHGNGSKLAPVLPLCELQNVHIKKT